LLLSGAAVVLGPSSLAREDSPSRLEVREMWATKGSDRSLFVTIEGMSESSDGTVWVSDPRASTVYGLAADGSEVHPIAQAGDGPGEVRMPHLIAPLPDGGVAVYDMGHNSVEVFDSDTSFRHRVPLQHLVVNPKGFAALAGDEFLLSGGIYGQSTSIHLFGLDGQLRKSWLPIPKTTNIRAGVLVAGGPVSVSGDGRILFSRAAPHEITVYSRGGDRQAVLARDETLLEAVGDDFIQERGLGAAMTRSFRWNFSQSKAIFGLPGGQILNVVRYFDRGESLWELYSMEGGLLARGTVQRAYTPWGMTRSGDVLASYVDPETQEHVAVRLAVKYAASPTRR